MLISIIYLLPRIAAYIYTGDYRVSYMIFITLIACISSMFRKKIRKNLPDMAYKAIPEVFLLLLLFGVRSVSAWAIILWLMSGFECYSVWMIKDEKQMAAALFGVQVVFAVYAFTTKNALVGMLELVAAAYYFAIYSANFLADRWHKKIKKI